MPNRTASARTVTFSKQLLRRSVIVALLLVLSGCATASVAPLPSPPKVSEFPTTTTLADFSNVSLPKVSGTTTVPAALFRGGDASISGRVTLGGAPIAGALVRVERFDGDTAAGSVDVTSDAGGAYVVNSLHGGRYRVRAFRAPDAAMPQAQVFFLGATEKRTTDLGMQAYSGGTTVNAFVTPSPPVLGAVSVLTVSVTSRGVDGGGIAHSVPLAGIPVTVIASGGRVILSTNPNATGSNGRALFSLQCNALDRQGLTVTIPGAAPVNVSVAECELPPTTTTAPPPPTTTTIATTTTKSPPTTKKK